MHDSDPGQVPALGIRSAPWLDVYVGSTRSLSLASLTVRCDVARSPNPQHIPGMCQDFGGSPRAGASPSVKTIDAFDPDLGERVGAPSVICRKC